MGGVAVRNTTQTCAEAPGDDLIPGCGRLPALLPCRGNRIRRVARWQACDGRH